jgi:DNA mismatch repair protein MutS2
MVTAKKVLADLRWDRIIESVASRARTAIGKSKILNDPFFEKKDDTERELGIVNELTALIRENDAPPFEGIEDVTGLLERADKEGILEPEELSAIGKVSRGFAMLKYFFSYRKAKIPLASGIASDLHDLKNLYTDIAGTIDENFLIRDSASEELARLRQEANHIHLKMRKRIEDMVSDPAIRLMLQDDYYTLRDYRYVLPVKSSEQNNIDGIIHGASQTGQTVYIEPSELTRENNRLKMIQEEIVQEEKRILREKTAHAARYAKEIIICLKITAYLDALCAKASFSNEFNCCKPIIGEEDAAIRLLAAKNPILLLKKIQVVANDIIFEPDTCFVVVSGPNAGGKSVTLSTAALCLLMVRAGLLIPADDRSVVPHFRSMYAIAGDRQDIEENLSTFTAHIKSLHDLVEKEDKGSFVIIDEMVTGTEPKKGAALAAAFLAALVEKGVKGLVATHYELLKTLGHSDKRFLNAALGLNPSTMKPEFRLKVGFTGESNPFEIARNTGIPESIIEKAQNYLDKKEKHLEELIKELSVKYDILMKQKQELDEIRKRLENEKKKYEESVVNISQKADRMVYEARREALREIDRAKDEARKIVREMQRVHDMKHTQRKRVSLIENEKILREKIADDEKAIFEKNFIPAQIPHAELKEGMEVYIRSMRQNGIIMKMQDGGKKANISAGNIKITVSADELCKPVRKEFRSQKTEDREKKDSIISRSEENHPVETGNSIKSPYNSIDLRGLRVDEALNVLEKRLDDAVLNDEKQIFVVHGIGTSALKNAVREYLKKSKYIRSFRAGTMEEGGDYVTIVFM